MNVISMVSPEGILTATARFFLAQLSMSYLVAQFIHVPEGYEVLLIPKALARKASKGRLCDWSHVELTLSFIHAKIFFGVLTG